MCRISTISITMVFKNLIIVSTGILFNNIFFGSLKFVCGRLSPFVCLCLRCIRTFVCASSCGGGRQRPRAESDIYSLSRMIDGGLRFVLRRRGRPLCLCPV